MLHVVILAIGSAFYPLGLAAVLVILATPRPLRMLVWYLVGGALVSVGFGLAVIFLLGGTVLDPGTTTAVTPSVELAMGALALLIAFVVATGRADRLRRRPRTDKEPAGPTWSERRLSGGSGLVALPVGMVMSLPSVYYLAALPYIVENYSSPSAQVALVILFNVIQFLFVEVPLIGFLVAPERTTVTVGRVIDALKANVRTIVVVVIAVIGAYMVVEGILGLIG